MKILVIGKDSSIGKEFIRRIKHNKLTAYNKTELDITNIAQIKEVIQRDRPNIIINCASYNDLEKAESNPDLAYNLNHIGVKNLVEIAQNYNIKLIYFSTNYIFAGNQTEPYIETDLAEPLSVFGQSKLLGENEIKAERDLRYLIFRVGFTYDFADDSIIHNIINEAKNNKELCYSATELSSPTSISLIVELVLRSIKQNLNGTYHLSCSSFCSYYDFAMEILKFSQLNTKLIPHDKKITNQRLKPKFSVLNNEKIASELGIKIPNWDVELIKLLKKYDY